MGVGDRDRVGVPEAAGVQDHVGVAVSGNDKVGEMLLETVAGAEQVWVRVAVRGAVGLPERVAEVEAVPRTVSEAV